MSESDDKAPWQVFGNAHGIEHMVMGYFSAAAQNGRWNGYFGGITEAQEI